MNLDGDGVPQVSEDKYIIIIIMIIIIDRWIDVIQL